MERSYKGITLAQLIHALYHGTWARGQGKLHERTFELKEAELFLKKNRPAPMTGIMKIDHLYGRPLHVEIDTRKQTFDDAAYNSSAGSNRACSVLRKVLPPVTIIVRYGEHNVTVDDDGEAFPKEHFEGEHMHEQARLCQEEREDLYRHGHCRNTKVKLFPYERAEQAEGDDDEEAKAVHSL